MSLFRKIVEGFLPSLTEDEEHTIRTNISDFDLAILKHTGQYEGHVHGYGSDNDHELFL